MAKLVAAIKQIDQATPPKTFVEYWNDMGHTCCMTARWRRLQRVYDRFATNGYTHVATMGRHRFNPKIRLVDGTKRTAILVALNRPVPFKWEDQNG